MVGSAKAPEAARDPDRPLRPLQAPRPLAEDAADLIREQILAGGFRQGEHLVEAKIARQLNVSRGPVREAFKLLRAEGLLDEEPRRGTFVVSLSGDDVREIYDLRAAIEATAARLAAARHGAADVLELGGLIEKMERAAAAGDVAGVSRSDLAFHDALCRLSGNRRLHEVFQRYVPTLKALLRLDEHAYRSLEDIAEEHHPLVEAIDAGDADLAALRFEEHCHHARDVVAGYIDSLLES